MTLSSSVIEPGFLVVHSNQLEQLRALVVQFCKAYPLAPLEIDQVLVQSNGIAQWLKLALAEEPDSDELGGGLGIAAAVQMQLPGRFVWNLYQKALPDVAIEQDSVFKKSALRWRLYQLLPALLSKGELDALAHLDWQQPEQLAALSHSLADLYDQYQVYRADWLTDWAAGHFVLKQADGLEKALPEADLWQAKLWQELVQTIPAGVKGHSRAVLHQRFLEKARSWTTRPAFLPRRVIVFGISSLPQQSLEVLAAIAPFTQVLLAVLNPCQLYWADAISEKDVVRSLRKRQQSKLDFNTLPAEVGAMKTQPLLASWGKQGRDYIRLLDQFDETAAHAHLFNQQRVDLFQEPSHEHLLGQLQSDILNLRSPEESQMQWGPLTDEAASSVEFHRCHSALREVEVLHDQLLAQFAKNPSLKPRDIMVMVPDIQVYAPFIQAVFGRFAPNDARSIPFSISDQPNRAQPPLHQALHVLLFPERERLAASRVFDLLDLPALQARFALAPSSLPKLKLWLEQAGVRWGLDEAHRQQLGLTPSFFEHSWWHGLERMLLGYVSTGESWQGVMPFTDSSGLEAAELGPLLQIFEALGALWQNVETERTLEQWVTLFQALLAQFFKATDLDTEQELQQLHRALEHLASSALLGEHTQKVGLAVARQAWLDELQGPGLVQRFITGRVNFATLLPMRAIPFKWIALLGMNDGDYPRRQPRLDFDLLARDYRAGDRSRRDDDRYLLLEALLSAREQLYISWVGFNVLDNSPRPPSVLVMQLRSHLESLWQLVSGEALLERLTVNHPLHSYSTRYLEHSSRLFSYRHEWSSLHQKADLTLPEEEALPWPEPACWSLKQLSDFLKAPTKFFFRQRLKLQLETEQLASLDDEEFSLEPLRRYQLQQQLLADVREAVETKGSWQQVAQKRLDSFAKQGLLAVGSGAFLQQQDLEQGLDEVASRLFELFTLYPQKLPERSLKFEHPDGQVSEPALSLYQGASGLAVIQVLPVGLYAKKELNVKAVIPGYLLQLLCSALGVKATVYLVSRQGELTLSSLVQEEAQKLLGEVLKWVRLGLTEPLAVDFKLALLVAKLQEKDPTLGEASVQKLASAYQGDGFNPGSVDYDRYLQRAWPDFTLFWKKNQLVSASQALYQHLLALSKESN